MKVFVYVMSVVLGTVIITGGTVAIVFLLDDTDTAVLFLAVVPLIAFTLNPLVLGSLRTYFDPARSADGRRYFQRALWTTVGLDVLAAVAAIVFTVIVGAAVWVPLVAIVLAAALLVASIRVGDALRRRDDRLDVADPVWQPFDRRVIRRKIITVSVTFVATFIAVTVLFLLLLRDDSGDGGDWAAAIGFGVVFGCFASGLACVIVALPIARALRGSLNKDIGLVHKFSRLILRRKNIELTEDERAPAARYASLLALSLSFNLASITLLYTGLLVQNLILFLSAPEQTLNGIVTLLLIVLYVIILPLTIRRVRRARQYASDHADLLPDAIAA